MADERHIERTPDRRLFGGGVGRTALQLIVASILVGAIFSVIGLDALEFWRGLFNAIRGFIETIAESFGEIAVNLITWLIIGGAVVIPIWLIAKLFKRGR